MYKLYQHFDIFMDNVDMVYMNIMICWNIIMVMCIYFGPAIDVCRRPIISKPWPYNLYICQTKQSIKAYCLLFVYFYRPPPQMVVATQISQAVAVPFRNYYAHNNTNKYKNVYHEVFLKLQSLQRCC
jgi:hypothetical protein